MGISILIGQVWLHIYSWHQGSRVSPSCTTGAEGGVQVAPKVKLRFNYQSKEQGKLGGPEALTPGAGSWESYLKDGI